jgi:hypothetical protein
MLTSVPSSGRLARHTSTSRWIVRGPVLMQDFEKLAH